MGNSWSKEGKKFFFSENFFIKFLNIKWKNKKKKISKKFFRQDFEIFFLVFRWGSEFQVSRYRPFFETLSPKICEFSQKKKKNDFHQNGSNSSKSCPIDLKLGLKCSGDLGGLLWVFWDFSESFRILSVF